MDILRDALAPIVIDIWSSVLELEAFECPADPQRHALPEMIVSIVHLTGERSGAVLLRCPPSLARRAAATMLGIPRDDIVDADIRDVIGELANVMAGNLKAALSDPYTLSLPVVVDSQKASVTLPGGRLAAHAEFNADGQAFSVSVYAQHLVQQS